LETLLKGELSVENYSEAVQHLKNISLNVSAIQTKSHQGVLEPEAPIIGNIGNSTKIDFILIPSGEFLMGSPSEEQDRFDDESPIHKVTIKNSFYMCKYPVTQKEWKNIMGNNPSYFKGEDMPVDSVSWEDAQEFIKKLNEIEGNNKYRLPSESEWEFACRAGTQTRYPFGDDGSKLYEYAWYDKNSGKKTHPVGQKKPNPWGLYDMHGNVWEWCQDTEHENYNGAPSDGSAWEGEIAALESFVVVAGITSIRAAGQRIALKLSLPPVTPTLAFAL
jgi:formylglycine-generating enzyme required for sulfatase activity